MTKLRLIGLKKGCNHRESNPGLLFKRILSLFVSVYSLDEHLGFRV